ncbi:tRNA (guanosine(37)-N1)-methyltransferase TrmD [Actinomyces faecalis]|uniref:tRNA (guanosine(37)-N1)-methyltransferase TrmD n=1 Tax=Actinomyces faecalis TaxID=2722820 RepID=UPI0015523BD2|nr:tRNA (guanosine(37)-N1)-methyltransferase TrmD [Actinomyces faecalis]
MRLDVLTIFPDYLRVLDLSLIGKAAETGLLDLKVHDLRSWTRDRHRTVDDTPLGGGAGMVMKPDVWGRALDEVLGGPEDGQTPAERPTRQVLVIPTPSGEVFTQRVAEDLAGADQIVFACGRYEGIDARVAQHYRSTGLDVRELSIGDYVLNGGEVASLVMIEAVTRLRPGVLGNPDSVVEESHSSAGLLEYAVYTRPVSWRGLDLAESWPELLGGNHALIARQRRDQAIARTAQRRPDMIERLDPSALDSADHAALARCGWVVPPEAEHPVRVVLRPALAQDVPALAALAARTFPDACPAFLSADQVAEHVATALSPQRLSTWVADPRVVVNVAYLEDDLPHGSVRGEELVGYSVVIAESADDDGALPPGLDARPSCVALPEEGGSQDLVAELSKVYVDNRLRGSGLASLLLEEAACDARTMGVELLWLGTHEGNRRAQRSYKRAGFAKVGTRSYDVGGHRCRDVVMARSLAG